MKTAIIFFENINQLRIPTELGVLNLHGYWKPPQRVLEFWSIGCKIEFITDEDYDKQKIEINNSYKECVKTFYKDYAL